MSTLGFNTGYVEDLYRQFLDNPASVGESWQEFFADYRPGESFVAVSPEARPETAPPAEPQPASDRPTEEQPVVVDRTERRPAGIARSQKETAPPPTHPDTEEKPIRGPAAKIAENMTASLGVPTATSVRQIPVKLMAENRRLINDHQQHVGGHKVSFTHIIAYAIVQGLKRHPNMNTTFRSADGNGIHVIPSSVNLGLAIDIEKRGKRTLVVPAIKKADTMTFAQLLGAYNNIVRRSRENRLEIADFQGTTATITNPGMIGTGLSVPRLMPGQGVIVGIGSIGYPPQYFSVPDKRMNRSGISQVMSITSTYDHRVIQGAESGAFLAYVEQLLRGEHEFYETVFSSLTIPYQPFVLASDSTPSLGISDRSSELDVIHKQASVLQLIRAFRVRGHLQADVNPLGYEWQYHPELDPATYGMTIWDLDREFVTGGLGGRDMLSFREILNTLRTPYTREVGIEFMHISDPGEKSWLEGRMECLEAQRTITEEEEIRMLQMLNSAEAFETFLHTKYIGHKRFSLEGSETIVPVLDRILSDAAESRVSEVVIGMAHRGRLNVLANILGKPYQVIFSEFEGSLDPNTTQGSGDVKYHLGATGVHEAPGGQSISVVLASNPSHLEAVNPVVEGMVRAKQECLEDEASEIPGNESQDSIIPILIHGDAAFAGQGVVAETLQLSQLNGYSTGGTIHLIINNQIGFTAGPDESRSSNYATDSARMIQAPIFHVNGDDPEACVRVARMALDYRQEFNKDVVIDMLCYRVRGHNEGDEPKYTQPLLYKKIETKRSVRKLYTERLLRRGDMTPSSAEEMLDDFRSQLQNAFEKTKELHDREAPREVILTRHRDTDPQIEDVPTAAPEDAILSTVRALTRFPDGFSVHKKLRRQFERREKIYLDDRKIDWGFAEALAFGTILLDGTCIRLSGQDSRRGTFSSRHAVVVDQETNDIYIPLNHISDSQVRLKIFDSLLSEYAACGFEYGYSVSRPEALVLWEAQFGDFANGAQIIFDQFLSAAQEKWGQFSSLVLLLPHGFEGQGPEHSSARLERFLQMCAEGNLTVCSFSTPANYFHALRRQARPEVKTPLVVMAPKSMLRHPRVQSRPEDLFDGGFQTAITTEKPGSETQRHVFCGGKVYFDLIEALEADSSLDGRIAVTRLEQMYPFPHEAVLEQLAMLRPETSVIWLQEEPENMGAWTFVRDRFNRLLNKKSLRPIHYVGRPASASPATGSAHVHHAEQEAIIREALSLPAA